MVQRVYVPFGLSHVAAWLEAGRKDARGNLRFGMSHRAAHRGAVRLQGPLPTVAVASSGRS
eukprot:1566600-Lingulodinium_polyedra.AAC.1